MLLELLQRKLCGHVSVSQHNNLNLNIAVPLLSHSSSWESLCLQHMVQADTASAWLCVCVCAKNKFQHSSSLHLPDYTCTIPSPPVFLMHGSAQFPWLCFFFPMKGCWKCCSLMRGCELWCALTAWPILLTASLRPDFRPVEGELSATRESHFLSCWELENCHEDQPQRRAEPGQSGSTERLCSLRGRLQILNSCGQWKDLYFQYLYIIANLTVCGQNHLKKVYHLP